MAIKRYTADADTTITNAFKPDLSTRGTGSNMGASDVLEVFSLYAQANSSSSELERILIKFPATGTQAGYIAHDRELGNIPASGSVSFYLRMFNAKHSSTTPKSYDLVVSSVKKSWDEGFGLDMEDFSDRSAANWINATDTKIAASASIVGTADLNNESGKAVATIVGTADLDDESGTSLILVNADGTAITFTTNSAKAFGDTVTETASPFTINTKNIEGGSEVRKATQACWIACKQAIDEGVLDMTISPTSWGDEEEFTLTQTTAGTAGNTAITLITGVTANGETAFTGGAAFILVNADTSTVNFITDPTLNFGDVSVSGSDGWIVNTRDISGGSEVRKATQALHIACLAAIAAGDLEMTAVPATDTGTQTEFTLTQTTAGTAGNTAITLVTGVTANGETAFTGGNGATPWTNQGGDIHDDGTSSFTASFATGFEDVGLDITPLVEQWIATTKSNYGMMVALSSSLEDAASSYYTKKFFARGSQFFYRRPIIEARWDNSEKDDRGAFYYSSSLAPAADNLNTLYLYNYVRGQLKNIPGIAKTGSILVSLYSGSSDNTEPTASKLQLAAGGNVALANELAATGGWVATGIYTASLAFTGSSTLTKMFDVWHTGTYESPDLLQYFTGTVKAASTSTSWPGSEINPNRQYVSKITNLKPIYSTANTSARFRLHTRKKDWSPTIYTKSSIKMPVSVIEEVFYKIVRANDGTEAVSYGTGSDKQTKLSYDASGSYFDFDLSMLEADNTYDIKFVYYLNGSYIEQPEKFRFKLVE